jgi:integrase
MATISKRVSASGVVSWRAQIRVKGRPALSATFPRKTDATRWAEQTEADLRRDLLLPEVAGRRHTLAELLERYLDHRAAMGGLDRQRVSQLRWWTERLGAFALADVTPARIATARDALLAGEGPTGAKLAPASAVRYLAALSHVCSWGERELGWLSSNPCRKVKRPQEPRGRVRFLDRETELPALLAACRESTDRRLFPLVTLALATGARQGELLGLRWSDVDLERRIATLHKTKNRERRALVLTAPAHTALLELRRVQPVGPSLVFGKGGKAVFPRESWERALARAGVKDFRFHDLRHSAASYILMSGGTLAEVAEVLGHKTLSMVKRYAHLSPEHVRGVVARMSAAFLEPAVEGKG